MAAVGANANDQVVMVFYSKETEDFFVIQEAIRQDEHYVLQPGVLPEGEFHFWTLLTNEKAQCSKTRYEGTLSI